MYPKKVARDTAKMLQSYLTYQAVRTIIDQLSETNPPQAIWLRQFSGGNKLQDGEAYIQELMAVRKDLVLRVLTVREELAESVVDLLPAMVRAGISESNRDTRCQLLERLTQSSPPSGSSDVAAGDEDEPPTTSESAPD